MFLKDEVIVVLKVLTEGESYLVSLANTCLGKISHFPSKVTDLYLMLIDTIGHFRAPAKG
jgi:hypothetical protein